MIDQSTGLGGAGRRPAAAARRWRAAAVASQELSDGGRQRYAGQEQGPGWAGARLGRGQAGQQHAGAGAGH